MDMATTMFPLKATTPSKGQTLPHNLWPKSVLHNIYAIRNRTKALRSLTTLVAMTPHCVMENFIDTKSPHYRLWRRVTNLLTLRTVAFPPILNLDTPSLTYTPDEDD